MAILHKNISAEGDIHNPKWFSGANNGDVAWRNELGVLESTDELVLPAALDFVDGSAAPPTSNSGDIYVLSSGASVNAGWGTVSLGDWVRYDGTTWNVITPQKSSLCYNEASDSLMSYTGLVWAGMGGGISSVNSAEKAVLSPSVGDFVYDTDLSSLQRYDGSNWISVANGYGLVSVTDSNGVPTYYTDLQTAINATANEDTVYIHSDIELTSAVSIPVRRSLTFQMNGNKIWGDNTLSTFNLFEDVLGVATGGRDLILIGGGVIEVIGSNIGTPFFSGTSNRLTTVNFGTTKIRTEYGELIKFYNTDIVGGDFYTEFGSMYVSQTLKGSKIRVYGGVQYGRIDSVEDCDITIIDKPWVVASGAKFINNKIVGSTNITGNYGVLSCSKGSIITGNYIEADVNSGEGALYVAANSTTKGKIANNVVVSYGTYPAGYFLRGSGYNNYFYSEDTWALIVDNSTENFSNNICVTNSLTNPAIRSQAEITSNNTAVCVNPSHTGVPLEVYGSSNQVSGNTAICYNNSTANIKLRSNNVYLANNIMSLVGAGIDLNGFTNAMSNTADAYGNLQIG